MRVHRVPPVRGGDTIVSFGTLSLATSPRPMAGPTARRKVFESGSQRVVGFEHERRLVTGEAELIGAQHDRGHAVVDTGHLQAVDEVTDPAGGQQGAAAGAGGVRERELDGRSGTGYPGDRSVPSIRDASVRCWYRRRGNGAVVALEDPYLGALAADGHEAAFDGEGPHPGEQVATVLPVRHDRRVHRHLQEEVVDVGVGPIRSGHHRHLGRQRMRTAYAIDLARVGAAHDAQQQLVALGRPGRQILGQEVRSLRRTTAHPQAAHGILHHPATLPCGLLGDGRAVGTVALVEESIEERQLLGAPAGAR